MLPVCCPLFETQCLRGTEPEWGGINTLTSLSFHLPVPGWWFSLAGPNPMPEGTGWRRSAAKTQNRKENGSDRQRTRNNHKFPSPPSAPSLPQPINERTPFLLKQFSTLWPLWPSFLSARIHYIFLRGLKKIMILSTQLNKWSVMSFPCSNFVHFLSWEVLRFISGIKLSFSTPFISAFHSCL